MDIFEIDLHNFSKLTFMPITDETPIDSMGEVWEMVLNQTSRISVWQFQSGQKSWYCIDLFIGDDADSFEMSRWSNTKFTPTQTLWLETWNDVLTFVQIVAEHSGEFHA